MNPIDELNKNLAEAHVKDVNVDKQIGHVDVKLDIDPKADTEDVSLTIKL